MKEYCANAGSDRAGFGVLHRGAAAWKTALVAAFLLLVTSPRSLAAIASNQTTIVNQNSTNNFINLSCADAGSPVFTLVTPPTNGALQIYDQTFTKVPWVGTVTGYAGYAYASYSPKAGYSGSDSFLWNCSDSDGTSATVTCSITVAPCSPPQALNQSFSMAQGASLLVALKYIEKDTGQTPYFELVTAPVNGTLTYWDNYNGGYIPLPVGSSVTSYDWYYAPNSGFTGTETFVWFVYDAATNSGNATCTITVTPNNPPVVRKILTTISCLENSISNDLTSFIGFTHADGGQTMTFTLVTAPTNGTLADAYDGSTLQSGGQIDAYEQWLYTPASNFTGSDSLTWNVSDGVASSSNATIVINVVPPPVAGQPPQFKAGVPLMDGTNAMRLWRHVVNGRYDYAGFATNANMAAPELVDWNNDGLMDLVVGEADGRIALYLNQGTKGHPVFNGYSYLAFSDGHEIRSWFGNCQCFGGGPECSAPRVVDWNNDGRKDLIVGEWGASSGWTVPDLFVFFNEGTDKAPVFKERFMNTSKSEIFAPQMNCRLSSPSGVPVAMPFVADWNGDGVSDLISGDNAGWGPTPNTYGFPTLKAPSSIVNVFLGTDNDHGPKGSISDGICNAEIFNWNEYTPSDSFQTTTPTITLTNVCPAGSRKSVAMVDWTGTGRKDLVVGMQDGTVWYSINVGTPNFPLFTNRTRLKASGVPIVVGNPAKTNQDLSDPASCGFQYVTNLKPINEARITVGDLDGDGLVDLVVGMGDGSLIYFQQYNPNPVAIDQQVLVMTTFAKSVALTARVDSGHAVLYTVLSQPTNGTLSGTAPNLTYAPNAGYNGPDSFTFMASDGALNSKTGTVVLTVRGHPPTAQWTSPATLSSTAIVNMNSNCLITLTATDDGDEPLSYSYTQPAHGTLSGTAPNLIYTPQAGYVGADSFTYQANDGYLDSNVTTVNLDVCVLAVNFQPAATPVPDGYAKDCGLPFDAGRGYGWSTNLFSSATRLDSNPDPRMDTYVASKSNVTWTCTLSNGSYYVSLGCGYWSSGEGHSPSLFSAYTQQASDAYHQDMISVQGSNVVTNAASSAAYSYLWLPNIPATVTNNQLTVSIGGGAYNTRLDFVEIRTAAPSSGSATFVAQDAATQGAWVGTYGGDGYMLCAGNIWINALTSYTSLLMQMPSYAVVNGPTASASITIPWAFPTNDVRGLQYPNDDSQMPGYWSVAGTGKYMIFDVNLTDGLTHRVAVYCASWNNTSWAETVDILDAAYTNNTLLDTRSMTSFGAGKYLVWNLQGHVKIRVSSTTSGSAAVSGIFFGDCAAPDILCQPLDVVVATGQVAAFDVIASGSPLAYAWQRSDDCGATWQNIPGANADSYTFTTSDSDNGAEFRCVVSNADGAATSDAATLLASASLPPPPVITSPLNVTANLNSSFTYRITALNAPDFFYAPVPPEFNFDMMAGVLSSGYTCVQTGSGTTWYYNTGVLTIPITAFNAGGMDTETLVITVNGDAAPVIGGQLTATGTVGTPFTYQIVAIVTTNPVTSYSAAGLPSGFGVNAVSGVITGMPTSAFIGTTNVTIGAKNSQGTGIDRLVLTINSTPGEADIVTQPTNVSVTVGQSAGFSVVAAGNAPLFYQWRTNGVKIALATNVSYNIPATAMSDNGKAFSVLVSNAVSYVLSANATLTVIPIPPAITAQPTNITVNAGQIAKFSVTATGTAPSYQWRTNGINISAAKGAAYTTAVTTANDNGKQFSVVVSNASGVVVSSNALLTVRFAPVITAQPTNATVFAGQTAAFTVGVIGTAPLQYQWRTSGVGIAQATNAAYTTPATAITDSGGLFSVVVTNTYGSATSSVVTLTVNLPVCFQSIAGVSGSGMGMDFMATPGIPYEVDWKSNLITDSWHLYTNLIGAGNNVHVCFTNAAPQGFFRIQANP